MNSIVDVAREAKVATSTVSLVLNTPSKVSLRTRQRVEEAIRRLNYRPRGQRQRLHVAVVYGRGLLFSGELVEFCRQWIIGVRDAFEAQGASVSVLTAEPHVSTDPMFLHGLKEGDFDGLITMGVYETHGYVEAAVEAGMRVVAMNRTAQQRRFSSVSEDHYGAGRLAARYLLDHGHRRIGCGYLLTSRIAATRQGVDDELRAAGAPPAVDLPLPARFEDTHAFRHAAQFAADAGVTACFCGDPAAYRLADSLIELGLRVPEDVSILGADNRGFRTSTGRRLTSLATNSRAMGQLAAGILQRLLSIGPDIIDMTATVPCRVRSGDTVARLNVS